VWDLRELPRRLLMVGGGPNGVELGQAMQRLGAQVTIVHHGAASSLKFSHGAELHVRLLLFIEKHALPLPGRKRRILGGAMVAPGAGELIQELILANASGLGISEISDKVYPYPVAARINQKLIVEH
jgi:pyruvate/2-oxoglutarate dehydrogenase complex dihydrolipoamide dehydrogenase (E3) component